jgi:DNA mismatch repair ATPase MutS
MEHREEALFEAFVVSNKRQRYLELLATKRGRDKIRAALDHFDDLDPRFCKQLASSKQRPADVLRTLTSLGAPSQC